MANESSVLVRLRLLGAGTFSREARTAGRSLGSVGREGATAQTQMVKLNKTLGATGTALAGVAAAAGVGGVAALSKGVGASVNFEQAMANVQARLLTTKGNMNLLSEEAIRLGGTTAFSANEAAGAMGEFAAAGFNTREIMAMMPGTLDLAAASGTDLAFAAETSGALLRQFGLKSKDAGHLADVMTVAVNKSAIGMDDLALTMKYVGPVAGRFGQSVEDIGAAAAILGNVGIKGETAGTTLRRSFVNLVKPSTKTQDMLAGMGITMGEFNKATVDARGELRPYPQMLGNLQKHIGALAAPQQRKILAQLFGVEALPGMLTLMGKGQKGIQALSRDLTNSGGAAKRTAGIMRGTVAGAWDQFTGSLETASIKMTRGALPTVRKGLLAAAEAVTSLVGGGAGGGIMAKARTIGEAIAEAGRQLFEAFRPAMPFIENVVLPLLTGIGKAVLGTVVLAFKVVVPIIRLLARGLGWLGTKMAPFKGVFEAIGYVIGFVFSGPILKLLGTIPKLGRVFALLRVPLRVLERGFKIVSGAVRTVLGWFGRAWTAVHRFVATFRAAPARVIRAAMNLVGGVARTIGQLPGKALKAGRGLVSGLVNAVRGKLGDIGAFFGRVGTKIVKSIVDAIKSAPGAITSALEELLPGPLKKAGGFLGGALKKVGLASGGTVQRGGMALVGERGPELVSLPTDSTVYSNRTSQRAAAAMSGGGAPILVTANLHLNGRQIHSEVLRVDRQMQEAT